MFSVSRCLYMASLNSYDHALHEVGVAATGMFTRMGGWDGKELDWTSI